jgi:hypothetical protein
MTNHCLNNALDIQGTTHDSPLLHLDLIARPWGHIVLDAQETREVILPKYHDFLPLFLEDGSQQLPLKCPDIDHEINLKPDFQPPFGSLYELSQAELKAQKEWLDGHLITGFI